MKDLSLISVADVARRIKRPLIEVQQLIDSINLELAPDVSCPVDVFTEENQEFNTSTTGDAVLDGATGGGVRTGMIWEICGER